MQSRIRTIEAIVLSQITNPNDSRHILDELDEFLRVSNIQPNRRRWLLKVLHLCRAVDSGLKQLLDEKGIAIPRNRRSLGGYLRLFGAHHARLANILTGREISRMQRLIVDNRNRYVHEAAAYPRGEQEVNQFFAQVEVAFTTIYNL